MVSFRATSDIIRTIVCVFFFLSEEPMMGLCIVCKAIRRGGADSSDFGWLVSHGRQGHMWLLNAPPADEDGLYLTLSSRRPVA